ncbi:MAG: response regulator [Polyangiaceae bacterium]
MLDDDPQIRRLLRRVLTFDRHAVEMAETVAEALAITGPFDLAVLDLNLPDGNGADVAEALLQRGATQRVVFFTASTEQPLLGRAGSLGSVIRKDAGLRALLAAI